MHDGSSPPALACMMEACTLPPCPHLAQSLLLPHHLNDLHDLAYHAVDQLGRGAMADGRRVSSLTMIMDCTQPQRIRGAVGGCVQLRQCAPTDLLLPLHGPALPMRSPVCNLPQAPLVTGQLMEGSPGAR